MRYKRSALGIWWTLLNPLLTTGVMWIVFGNFFRFEIPGDVRPTSSTCSPGSCSSRIFAPSGDCRRLGDR